MATFKDALHIVQSACLVISVPGCAPSLKRDVKVALHYLEVAVDVDTLSKVAGREGADMDSSPLLGPKAQAAYDHLHNLLEAEGVNPDALEP